MIQVDAIVTTLHVLSWGLAGDGRGRQQHLFEGV